MATDEFYIVGVGTSAGGLEALERFFKNMPANQQLAFLVVQHLSPDYKSHMVELLSKYAQMPVQEASDGVRVEPGNIYVLPPRKNMTIFKRKLYLVEYDRSRGLNLPIDILFESLAKDQGNRAIGCILSGTGSDGTRGIRAVKEYGGIVLAQDDSARFDGMPRSAISTQLVDYIAAPEHMPEILVRYVAYPGPTSKNGQQSKLVNEQDLIGKVLAILRDHNSVDFTGYKQNTLIRRIERRMSLFEITSLEDYIEYLQKSDKERRTLFKEFLISVTSFFRDPEAFEFIQTHVVPMLLEDRDRRDQVRIWVPGCATGEEAYSLAILFQEYMERTGRFTDVKIFATDLDRDALERAGQGVFPESVMADIPMTLLKDYFVKQGDYYEILRQIRSMVVFAHQNLVKDPPFSRIDLISCRNLLIYLQPEIQNRVLSIFQFALKPRGYLFLGSSESLGDRAAEFSVENAKWKIYRFRGAHNPLAETNLDKKQGDHVAPSSFREPATPIKHLDDWRNSDPVLRSLVEHVLPPCVVIDEHWTMLHGFGNLNPYLHAPRGYQVNLNILKLVRDELSIPLSTALHRTFKDGEDVAYRQIEVQEDNGPVRVDITTRLFWHKGNNHKLGIILFTPSEDQSPKPQSEDFKISDGVHQRITNLEQELQYTRENLQATIEELETSNEELQATNEELMAANEELQSTNEELESVNEELLTVNNEYQVKIKELSALNDDMDNLLKSIDIGTIFLDADLNVRKFTPAAQQAINLLDQDVGRPIQHFSHKLMNFDLSDAIEEVIENLITREYEVQSKSGQWYLLRISPYRTHTNQISGVVLTMVDVTELREAAQVANESDAFTQVILNSLSAQIAVLDNNGVIVRVNDAWRQFASENDGANLKHIGTNYLEICRMADGEQTEGASECYQGLRDLIDGKITEFDLEYPCHAPHEKRWFLLRAVPLNNSDGSIVVSHIDITQRKLVENALRQSDNRFRLAAIDTLVALFEHDMELKYTWIHNKKMAYPPAHAHGCTDTELLSALEAGEILRCKREVLETGHSHQSSVHITVDQQTYRCDMILEPVFDEDRQIRGIIGAYSTFEAI